MSKNLVITNWPSVYFNWTVMILYQSKKSSVSIGKEIELIENYISLEKLRYGNELSVSFQTDVDDPNTDLSPLLLLNLVENAFKHGASTTLADPEVHVLLQIKKKQLRFIVSNLKGYKKEKGNMKSNRGIGLSNLQAQLDLTYKEHHLDIQESEKDFRVELFINLETKKISEETPLPAASKVKAL